jgi:dTDP-4-amino-4,6-dideoxygalactose transaminase
MKKIIPITKPTLRPYASYAPFFKASIESGMLTTNKNVREFEKRTARYLGVKHCVAVSTCTSGLMLVMKGLGLKGEVILPSFTFSASGHPLMWSGLTPVFAEIKKGTYELDPKSVEKLITKKTSAILATHVFGVPCDIEPLKKLAKKHNLKLIFDAAHAFGSSYKGVKVGNFGDAEVFSCSPTKVLTTGEGGIVATNNAAFACR